MGQTSVGLWREEKRATQVGVFLPNTVWGRSNSAALRKAAPALGVQVAADAQRRPIVSHWGVTGGGFAEVAGDALDRIDFAVIQTYSFIGDTSPDALRVLVALKRHGITRAEDMKSPVGVAHAYGLVHPVAQAMRKAGSSDRAKVRAALEQQGPHGDLVRRYTRSFTPQNHCCRIQPRSASRRRDAARLRVHCLPHFRRRAVDLSERSDRQQAANGVVQPPDIGSRSNFCSPAAWTTQARLGLGRIGRHGEVGSVSPDSPSWDLCRSRIP